jgi:hypothetical protein
MYGICSDLATPCHSAFRAHFRLLFVPSYSKIHVDDCSVVEYSPIVPSKKKKPVSPRDALKPWTMSGASVTSARTVLKSAKRIRPDRAIAAIPVEPATAR